MQNTVIVLLGAAVALGAASLAIGKDETAPGASKASEGVETPVAPAEEAAELDRLVEARGWVRQLAADSFKEREEAQNKIWAMGEDAMEVVEEGAASDDPEVAYRARILLQRIRSGITPETPPEIIDLVQKYFKAGAAGKKTVLEGLLEVKAYPQMMLLYRYETDEAARSACDDVLSKAVMPAVLGELVEGRMKEAESILRLAPATDKNSQSLAALLRVRGKLADELKKTEGELEFKDDGSLVKRARQMDVAALRLALLRAEGKTAEARDLAEKMDRQELVAGLALFEGDAVPYFNWFMETQDRSPILRLHGEIALKRWQNDEKGAGKIARNIAEVARTGGVSQREALLSLMLNGYMKDAMPVVERDHSDSAFGYYETVEQPLKALEVIGYLGGPKQKKEWLETRLKVLRKDWNDSDPERFDVLTVASFMQTRGEVEEARRLVNELSAIAKGEGEGDWMEFLGRLKDMGGSLFELGFYLGAERLDSFGDGDPELDVPDRADADEDDADKGDADKGDADKGTDEKGRAEKENAEKERARKERAAKSLAVRVIEHLFGEGDSALRLWERLAQEENGMKAGERLMMLGALYGVVDLDQEKLDGVLTRLHARTRDIEGEQRTQMLTDMLEAAESRDDAGQGLLLLEELAVIGGEEMWAKRLSSYYGYVADWKRSAKALEIVLKAEPRNLRYLAYYGGAQLRAGNAEAAAKALQEVEMFGLDESIRLLRLAIDLERSGAMDEAAKYWKLLLITNPPSDWYWQSSTTYMAKHARRAKQWRVAAAFAEVDALQYMRGRSTYLNPAIFIRKRFTADLYRALALREEGDKENSDRLLRSSFEMLNGDGMLADDYFPLLREAGAIEEHDRNYKIVSERLKESIKAFPKAHNTYNSAAWMASRASRQLDGALENITTALEMRPRQAAYLDTAAEVWFAKRNREKAVEWSRKAVMESYHGGHSRAEGGVELRDQYDRFRFEEYPVE